MPGSTSSRPPAATIRPTQSVQATLPTRGHRWSADAVVGHRQLQVAVAVTQLEPAPTGAGVPQHVGGALADHPGERLVGLRRERTVVGRDLRADPRGVEGSAGAVELLVQGQRAHRVHGLAHFIQCVASDALDVLSVFRGCGRVAVGEPTYGLGLDHHHRQRVPQQVVQVPGESLALLGDCSAGQFLPGPLQLLDRLDQAKEAGARHPREQYHEALAPDAARASVVTRVPHRPHRPERDQRDDGKPPAAQHRGHGERQQDPGRQPGASLRGTGHGGGGKDTERDVRRPALARRPAGPDRDHRGGRHRQHQSQLEATEPGLPCRLRTGPSSSTGTQTSTEACRCTEHPSEVATLVHATPNPPMKG